MKLIALAMPTKDIKTLVTDLRASGYNVKYDNADGTMIADLDGVEVARALKMRGRWCLRADPDVVKVGGSAS